jgi:imidazolonepropionase-like amidohydrolase
MFYIWKRNFPLVANMKTHRKLALLCGALLLAGCAAQPHSEADLYYGFTRIDPDTRSHVPAAWLVVQDGKIARVGTGTPPAGAYRQRRDMAGLYAMPGLIDAHAHLVAGPYLIKVANGAVSIDIAAADKYTRFNAVIALAFGITTLRNPGGSTEAAARYDTMRASGDWIGPQALHAGRVIEPPPMSGQSIAYPKTAMEWDTEAARQRAAGMTYFKLYRGLTEAELAQGVRAANKHGLIPIAHSEAVSWTKAAALGIRQIEHTLPISTDLLAPDKRATYKPDAPPSYGYFQWFQLADLQGPQVADMVRTLRDKDIVVTPTLMAQDIISHADDLTPIFPASELPYYQPESFASAKTNYDAIAKIWKPQDFAAARATWPSILRFIRLLHESGVRLMIGTDGTGGAPMYARELHNMAQAGLSNWEVLRMATSGNAELMGLSQTGRIATGQEADIVFLRADPALDVRNVRQVEMVVSDGKSYSFDELIALAKPFAE